MSKDCPYKDLRENLKSKQSKRRVILQISATSTTSNCSPQVVENNISSKVNEIGKRAYDDQDKTDGVKKRLCNRNQISSTTPKNPVSTEAYRGYGKRSSRKLEASSSKIPENKQFSGQQDYFSGIYQKTGDGIKKPREEHNNHNDRNRVSTTKKSAWFPQSFKPFKTGETISRNLDSLNHTTATSQPVPMSYTCLKNLCNDQVTPEDASSKLAEQEQLQRFEALLQEHEIRYDLMKLIIFVVYKVCQSRISAHLNRIIGIFNKVRFWSTLAHFIVELETKIECLSDPQFFFILKHLCEIFSISLQRLPYLYSYIPLLQLQSAVKHFKENGNLPIDSTIDSLLMDVTSRCELEKKKIREKAQEQAEPPDDFRTLSVFPTEEEIFKKGKPFLREIIVKKPFSSVDQYLDIHFRLLKEDSIAGLRNGIWNLKKSHRQQQYGRPAVDSLSKPSNAKPQNDVIVYNDVNIKERVPVRSRQVNTKGIIYNVAFNSKDPSFKRINWERSKRLLSGSLVCLISTDFDKVYFATVQNRKLDRLSKGYVHLCFEGDEEYPGCDDMRKSYHMIESSSAYFVAYRHILERLQDMNEETIPFKKYIVFCEHEIGKMACDPNTSDCRFSYLSQHFRVFGSSHPAYLKIKSEEENPKTINLESAKVQQKQQLLQLADDDKTFHLKNVSPYDLRTWPDGDIIGLNESQYKAFRSALLREFAVIQGPPGTGKTYVGLKIAHTLLHNSHLWKETDGEKSCPILMLAYTNHALDSFLEGLTISRKDIIRVGGRSSSDVLKECNIAMAREERRITEYQNGVRRLGGRRFRQVEREKEKCHATLNGHTELYAKSYKGILPAKQFARHMRNEHKEYFPYDNDMLTFLGISLNPVAEQNATKLANEEGFDEFHGQELGGHFYVGHTEDADEQRESKNEFLICFAEDTYKPEGILDLLRSDVLEVETAEKLEERTGGADFLCLSVEERWSLYLLWLARLREYLGVEIRKKQTKYLELSNEYEELRNIEDLAIMRNSRVVGMTTTCASKNHKLLRQLQPRVVIIEEAAELFEAHVVTSLTEYCQHLILIGDHQQLRPNPSVYNLSVKYSLDVSLLERMVEAGVPYNRLSVQHRMRPEISRMFRHIYDGLEDHASVTEYENIQGVSTNLFFIDHDVRESVHDNVHSKVNQHEAEFMVELCLYFLRQGYKSSQITILTTYKGQMFVIRDLIKSRKDEFEDDLPRVSSVDNFQGEENDIILLSLVRNNEEEKIGFLETTNRVCVALSRARNGLYIIGNRKMLSNQSPLWKEVLVDFDNSGYIGKSLPLVCSNHQTQNSVSCASNFKELVPNGGCLEKCQHRLECGHACPQMCHPSGHENFKCEKPCTNNVSGCDISGHKCTKLCYEMCDDICQYPVNKILDCGHQKTLACSDDVNIAKCKEQCVKKLVCGHRCQAPCSAPCTKNCMETVKKRDLSCGHDNTMACSATQKDCRVPCNALLECGHPCVGKCGQCIQGRVHVKCAKKCNRNLVCLHQCMSSCTKDCPPCKEKCPRRCRHSKCEKSCGEICIPCKEPCEWECEHYKCTQLCSETCDRPRCDLPCKRKLTCGDRLRKHVCRGLCGERCVCTICNTNNGQDVRTILFGTEDEKDARFIRLKDCEHIFEYTALDKMMDGIDNEIKPKVCPLCTMPVVKSLRYGNVVKRIHKDLDGIKKKILHSTTESKEKRFQVLDLAHDLESKISLISMNMKPTDIAKTWKLIFDHIVRMQNSSSVYYQDIILFESGMRLLKYWYHISKSYEEALQSQTLLSRNIEFDSEMQYVLSRILDLVLPGRTSTRILRQLNLELQRLSLKKDILVLKLNCSSIEFTLDDDDDEIVTKIQKVLQNKEIIMEYFLEEFKEGIADIYSRNPQLSPITKEEKIQIVHAIGLEQGHWFKCPNGHFYAIGECGGAMEESKCPECDAVIGGQNHRLADGNELAPEMDGAAHPAWSDQANMENYQFDD